MSKYLLLRDNKQSGPYTAEEMIANRPIDLIEIETAKESLRQAIQRYGLEL